MSIISKLSIRQLFSNKKRTILTIIGVIITVAMLTAVFTFGSSFQMMMRNEVLNRTGEWEVCYSGVNSTNLAVIAEDENTKSYWLEKDKGLAKINDDREKTYQFLSITEVGEPRLSNRNIVLESGRLPERQGEIAVPAGLGFTVGQQLTLDTGYRQLLSSDTPGEEPAVVSGNYPFMEEDERFVATGTVSYTVVGLMKAERNYNGGAAADAYAYFDKSALTATTRADMYVSHHTVSAALLKDAKSLAEKAGMPVEQLEDGGKNYPVSYNSDLLRTYGISGRNATDEMILRLESFFVAIILAAGIALIYNAFAVSVSERTKQMGMLSSVGATGRQRRRMVYFEGLLIGLVSIPLGILFGLLGMKILFLILNNLLADAMRGVMGSARLALDMYLSPEGLAATIVLALLAIFLSAFIPALRAGRLSPITAIRQSKDVKLTARRVKTSRLTRKVFGFPAELGLKNLKRNKKRYRITIFSLSISIVLFLTVSSYSYYMQKAIEMEGGVPNYDVVVRAQDILTDTADTFKKVEQETGVEITDVLKHSELCLNSLVDGSLIDGAFPTDEQDGKQVLYLSLIALDDASMERFCAENGLAKPDWENGQATGILLNRGLAYSDDRQRMECSLLKVQAGDSIVMAIPQITEQPNGEIDVSQKPVGQPIVLSAVTDATPEQLGVYGSASALRILVPEKLVESLKDVEGMEMTGSIAYYTTDGHVELAAAFADEDGFSSYDSTANRNGTEKLLLALNIGIYGFVTLIILICAVNILSTISTSISLRTREFAMLRSVGMTSRDFSKMLNFESIFYGLKALLYGLPLSFLITLWLYNTTGMTYRTVFSIPVWSYVWVVAGVILLVWLFMMFSSRRLKKQNILESMKTEVL